MIEHFKLQITLAMKIPARHALNPKTKMAARETCPALKARISGRTHLTGKELTGALRPRVGTKNPGQKNANFDQAPDLLTCPRNQTQEKNQG
jgi:hypothetical protein